MSKADVRVYVAGLLCTCFLKRGSEIHSKPIISIVTIDDCMWLQYQIYTAYHNDLSMHYSKHSQQMPHVWSKGSSVFSIMLAESYSAQDMQKAPVDPKHGYTGPQLVSRVDTTWLHPSHWHSVGKVTPHKTGSHPAEPNTTGTLSCKGKIYTNLPASAFALGSFMFLCQIARFQDTPTTDWHKQKDLVTKDMYPVRAT